MQAGANPDWLEIGNVQVHLSRREVIRDGQPVQLSWRAFEALAALIEAHGAVVERSQLFARLWPGLHVEDSSLNHCILQVRKAVGEGIVETIPRIGYRLLTRPVDNEPPVKTEAAPGVS